MKHITAYNQNWQERFVQIISFVREFFPDNCAFHHIGSTSVPGMPAKDIIDLDIEYAPGAIQEVAVIRTIAQTIDGQTRLLFLSHFPPFTEVCSRIDHAKKDPAV